MIPVPGIAKYGYITSVDGNDMGVSVGIVFYSTASMTQMLKDLSATDEDAILRATHDPLQDAWDEYQLLLKLYK